MPPSPLHSDDESTHSCDEQSEVENEVDPHRLERQTDAASISQWANRNSEYVGDLCVRRVLCSFIGDWQRAFMEQAQEVTLSLVTTFNLSRFADVLLTTFVTYCRVLRACQGVQRTGHSTRSRHRWLPSCSLSRGERRRRPLTGRSRRVREHVTRCRHGKVYGSRAHCACKNRRQLIKWTA